MKPASPWKIALLLGVLFMPAISYYLISRGKNNFKKLEIFGPKEVGPGKEINGKLLADTIYHKIPTFSFTDQFGREISDKTLTGDITIVDFFFTSCKTICPKMSDQLTRVQAKFVNDSDVRILSFTVDPENDSVPVLEAYSKKYNAVKDKWYFLTGDKTQLYELARNGYFLAAIQSSKGPDDFDHSEQLVLVDKDKRIRGYYDGTDVNDVGKLMDEILVLQWEYKNKN